MIFSKFLKKKWQHKNTSVRVEAINSSLSINEPEQLAVIQDLATNDESENVRRAALIKLNNYQSWLLHSQENTLLKVQQYAAKKVASILMNEDEIKISEAEKLAFIENSNNFSFFESWLKTAEETALIITLFEKIASKSQHNDQTSKLAIKPQLLLNLFSQKQSEEVQGYILNKVDDLDTLEKLKKKSQLSVITQQLNEKIAKLQFSIDQPIVLRKKIDLVLAKLQALKDQYDYQVYLEKRTNLNVEWQTLITEFANFESLQDSVLLSKHKTITVQLDKLFAAKAEQHAQAEIARELLDSQEKSRVHFDKTLTIIDQTLTTSIFENDHIEEQQYQTLFDKLTSEIIASPLAKEEQNSFIAKICQQQQKLQKLPEIAQSVSDATHLISKISQLSMPTSVLEMNERLPVYQDWLSNWQDVEKNAAGILPDSIKNAASEIQRKWRQAVKPLQQIQKQEFGVAQKKLHDVKRLIASGKYNAAFGVFKKATQLFNALSEQQKNRIQKDYDAINEKITELADWEHYIATPRKQQLLTDIKIIVETPLDNPNEQAEKVKQYRKTWNSLGHADDEAEQQLNTEFNQLCEAAFAPCRLFFAEQEKLRAQHLQTRQSYLEQATLLANTLPVESVDQSSDQGSDKISTVDFKSLELELNQLIKQWQSAGQVDRALYQEINQQFNNTLQPVKSAIKVFHEQNKQLKQQLISSAKQLLDQDDVFSAVNQVKALQNKWRSIGYAGHKVENKLWQNFRKINDDIFAKRDQQSALEKSVSTAKATELELSLQTLLTQYSQVDQLPDLQDFKQALETLQLEVMQQKPKLLKLEKQIIAKDKSLSKKIADCKQANEKQQWLHLFATLEQGVTNKTEFTEQDEFQNLSTFWQKKLKDLANKDIVADRKTATLELEILSGIPSPSELQQSRMEVQVNLMQTQMLSGTPIDLEDKFSHWLMLGKFEQNDLVLLDRVKPIFQ
ncbi:DUF349 domain-containing protein [Colwellia polaris]|uniref:DUF349 domain-containing protein n=1 Tax=Colwellia polaris TaxID=326537 RepID=UPI000A176932|nr:DUF349 domain-containing protein [Colwellia polaris]